MQRNESMNSFGPLVGAIDEGTSSVRFLVSKKKQKFILQSYVRQSFKNSHQFPYPSVTTPIKKKKKKEMIIDY